MLRQIFYLAAGIGAVVFVIGGTTGYFARSQKDVDSPPPTDNDIEVESETQGENKEDKKEEPNSKPSAETKTETKSIQEDVKMTTDTKNWVNYTDKANGIALKYPNGWKVKDKSGITNNQKYSYKWFQSDSKKDTEDFDFSITLITDKSLNDMQGSSISVGGRAAIQNGSKYYVENKDQLFEIEIRNQEFGQTILSTLKFN